MKQSLIFIISALALFASCSQAPKPVTATSQIPSADPFILTYEGKYYLYGTGEPGFRIYVSEDLENWEKKGIALDIDNSWGTKQFWAPEVYCIGSRFYLFYSSEEHICMATADNPEGPFSQEEIRPIREEKGIDTSLYIDEDGTPYLYFVRFTGGNVIWAAEMEDDLTSIKEETLTECIRSSEDWELMAGKIAEGPSVFKIGDTYYLLYSANDTKSQEYAVGYATASSPLGPWTKSGDNPLFKRGFPNAGELVGIGHGAPFHDLDGKFMYVFHAHRNDTTMYPRCTYINTELKIASDGRLSMPGDVIVPALVGEE